MPSHSFLCHHHPCAGTKKPKRARRRPRSCRCSSRISVRQTCSWPGLLALMCRPRRADRRRGGWCGAGAVVGEAVVGLAGWHGAAEVKTSCLSCVAVSIFLPVIISLVSGSKVEVFSRRWVHSRFMRREQCTGSTPLRLHQQCHIIGAERLGYAAVRRARDAIGQACQPPAAAARSPSCRLHLYELEFPMTALHPRPRATTFPAAWTEHSSSPP